MATVLTIGQMLAAHARTQPEKLGARDLDRQMTWREWNLRACRLANGLPPRRLAVGGERIRSRRASWLVRRSALSASRPPPPPLAP